MNCPHCNFHFGALLVHGGEQIPDLAPIVCEDCGDIALIDQWVPRRLRTGELEALQQSPAWGFIAQAQKLIQEHIAQRRRKGVN